MAINATFLTALDALLAQHGLARSMSGSTITIIDNDGASLAFEREGRWLGLERQDFGRIVTVQNRRFKVVGVKASRPKYPIDGECVSTGKVYKMPRSVIAQLEAQRTSVPTTPAASAPTQLSTPSQASQQDDRYANVGMF